MSDFKNRVYLDDEIWLKVIDLVVSWFNDKDDALNWNKGSFSNSVDSMY